MNTLKQKSELSTLDVAIDRVPKQTVTLEQYRAMGGNVVHVLEDAKPPTPIEVHAAQSGVNHLHGVDFNDPRDPRNLAEARQNKTVV